LWALAPTLGLGRGWEGQAEISGRGMRDGDGRKVEWGEFDVQSFSLARHSGVSRGGALRGLLWHDPVQLETMRGRLSAACVYTHTARYETVDQRTMVRASLPEDGLPPPHTVCRRAPDVINPETRHRAQICNQSVLIFTNHPDANARPGTLDPATGSGRTRCIHTMTGNRHIQRRIGVRTMKVVLQ
jgi:hypothetical protein